jgi:putative Mn2+ efflux pump MntP
MDAFAVSICKGLSMKKATLKAQAICGGWFGGFQALMPLVGFFLGTLFAEAIEAVDHWVAFILLAIIGINMLREAFDRTCDVGEECGENADLSVKSMFLMAVATSIDALAVGISLAMAGDVNIWLAISLIGVITFLMSAMGVKVGNVFGSRFEKKAEAAGGVILILLGLKILLEHLGIIA